MTQPANFPTSLNGALPPARSLAAAAATPDKARATAIEFETTFLTSMLESLFSGVEVSKPFGGGNAEQQFRSVLLGEYAGNIAQAGGIGVADAVYREILAMQEGQV